MGYCAFLTNYRQNNISSSINLQVILFDAAIDK